MEKEKEDKKTQESSSDPDQAEDNSKEDNSYTTSSSILSQIDDTADASFLDDGQEEFEKQKMETEDFDISSSSQIEPTEEQRLATGSKNKQRKADAPEYFGTCDIPVYHKVDFTVAISFGLFFKQLSTVAQAPEKKKNDAPTPLGNFHIEFRLLPNDDEVLQMDIIPYANFARVLFDRNDSKTVKYYYDGQVYWVIWNQIFEVDVTNDLLLQLFDYTIEVNVWDSKERLMTRSRFDKPRGMKFDIDEADIKKQVNFQKELLGPDERNCLVPEINTPPDNSNLTTTTNIISNESEFQLDKSKQSGPKSRGNVNSSPTKKGGSKESKEPVTKVLVSLRYFFSDQRNITKRLEKPIEGLVDMMVSVTLNRSLLSEQQKRNLNPVVINVHSITDLPGSEETGYDYSQLKAKCYPVYLKYKFIHNKPYKSPGRLHQKQIIFDDINVILTGNMDSMELREYFLGPGLVIEIHDRDRKPSTITPQTLLFGDDLNDEKLSNIGVITSKMTKINPYKSPPANSLDPFGVARFDMAGFTLGQKFSYQELPILNGPTLDSLQNAEAENVNFVKKVNSDSRSFMPGQYVQSCAMIKITIKLAYPLIIPPIKNTRPPVTPTYNCPFGRMVFRIGTARQDFLEEVLLTIARVNGEALGLTDVPDNILIATLLTLITTRHQRFDRLLDIITGFHIIDNSMHLLVVEGLQHQGIQILIDQFGETDLPDVTILFNTSLICSDRLYASFDVILRKVKLHEPLDSIVQQPLIYIRDMVPRLCYDALIQLHEIKKCSRLIDAVRNNLFPTANMVRSLSKEFGVVIKEDQLKIDASTAYHEDQKKQVSLLDTLAEEVTDHRKIKWGYTDHKNKPYVQMLKRNLHSAPADIISRNIDSVIKASKKLKAKKMPERTVKLSKPLDEVHNYGMSTYNTVELKKLELRRHMNPKSMYTYCPDFHHSMTFAPMELEHVYKEEEIRKMQKWRTSSGWVYPGFKSSLDSYVHPKKPSPARIKELSQFYSEAQQSEFFDPRERCAFSWSERGLDMDIWRQPTIDLCEKVHVVQCDGDQCAIGKENDKKDAENWKSKVVVKNARTRFHRQLTETELKMQGRLASCQLDRMKGLLKGKPIRRAFRYRSVADMPSLDVVNYPELSANSADRKLLRSYDDQKNAFSPGPYYPERSLKLVGNYTQTHDYEHNKFVTSKGKDFKTRHMPHDPIFKGKHPVLPVSEEEKYTDYRNLKKCFCRSHTMPEICKRCIFQNSGPPYTADANMERFNDNNNRRTGGKNITGVKPGSPVRMDH